MSPRFRNDNVPAASAAQRGASPKPLLLAIAGIFLSLVVLAATYNSLKRVAARLSCDFYFPYLKAASMAEDALADDSLLLHDRRTLAKAVERLQRENFDLAAKAAILSGLQQENFRLREMYAIAPKGSFKPLFAELLSRDPVSWNERFVIDKGRDDGIEEGCLVVTMAADASGQKFIPAAVGRVKSVSKRSSVVSSILSDECKLSVSIQASGSASGILEGDGHSCVTSPSSLLKFLPVGRNYTPGAEVATSGFSALSPQSIYVGRLAKLKDGSAVRSCDNIFLEARVEPAADIERVRFVAVYVKVRR